MTVLAVVLHVAAVVSFTMAGDPPKDAWHYLEKADEARERAAGAREKHDATAEAKAVGEQVENLRLYLQQSPDDTERLESYALLLAENVHDTQSFELAIASLEKVVEKDPDRYKSRKQLIEFLLLPVVQRYNDANKHLEYLLRQTPNDPETLVMLGRCQMSMKRSEQAIGTFKRAIECWPSEAAAYYLLATSLRYNLQRPQEADAWMDKMAAANPKSAAAHRLMCEYFMPKSAEAVDLKKAWKHAELAMKLEPGNTDSIILAARCGFANKDYASARRYAEKGLETEKHDLEFRGLMYAILSDAEIALNHEQKALEHLQKAFAETKSPEYLRFIAVKQCDRGDAAGAAASLKELIKLGYHEGELNYLRGRVALLRSQWREACDAFEKVENLRPSTQKFLHYWLGVSYGQLGNGDRQIAALRRALEIDPQFAPAKQLLADALRRAGKTEEAMKEVSGVAKDSKDPSAILALVGMQIEQKRRLPPAEQHWEETQKLLDQAEKEFPGLLEISLSRSDVLFAQNRGEEAEKMLRGLLMKDSKNGRLWEAVVKASARRQQWSQTEQILERFEKWSGDCVELRLAKADYYVRRYGTGAALRLVALKDNVSGYSDAQKSSLWFGLLHFNFLLGNRMEMQKLLGMLEKADPNNLDLHLLRFEQAAYSVDLPGMEKTLADIERIEGKGPTWMHGKAYLLLKKVTTGGDKAMLEEALKLLEQAKEVRPTWGKVPLLMGEIHDRKGQFDSAVERYLEALGLGEYNPPVIRRAIQILYLQQRFKEADEMLGRVEREQTYALTPELVMWWTEMLLQRGNYELAVQKAHLLSIDQSKDYKEPFWLGRIMRDAMRQARAAGKNEQVAGFAAEAERCFRRAVELSGSNLEPHVDLVTFLIAENRLSEAESAFGSMKQKPAAKRWPLGLAQCYEALKKIPLAAEQYEAALAARPKDPRVVQITAEFYQRIGDLQRAESLLNRVLEEKSRMTGEADLVRARRQLAYILANRGGYGNLKKARDLIGKNLAVDPQSTVDKRILAQFDAGDPLRNRREEAIATYKNLLENQQIGKDELVKLAQLYLEIEDWKNARETLRKLLADYPDDLKSLAFYIRELLRHQEIAEAEVKLAKLEAAWPHAVHTILLRAESLLLHDKAEDALKAMNQFIEDPQGEPSDRSQRLLFMATAMEDFVERLELADKAAGKDLLRTAESHLRQYVDLHPSDMLNLIEFYARQKRFEVAADYLEKNWKKCEPGALAAVCDKVAEGGRGSKEIVERVQMVLHQGRLYFLDHPAIVLTQANFCTVAGKYDEAEKIFRATLEKNPNEVVAMNNLAALLIIAQKNLPEALELVNKAIAIAGPLAALLDTRASIYIAQGQADKALADLAEALARGKTAELLFHQAQAYELAGKRELAAKSMKESLAKGLNEKTLNRREIPIYQRLKKMAEELRLKKEDDEPMYIDDYAAAEQIFGLPA